MLDRTPVVLYVEDEDDQREVMVTLLETDGLGVVPARNGEDALNLLRAGLAPDIVLTDLRLPRMSGVELVMAIWAIPECENLPIAVLTGAELPPRGVPERVVVFQKACGVTQLLGAIRSIAAAQLTRAASP